MFRSKNKPEAGVTLIANNCELTGDIHFSDQLLVNGTVKGNIHAADGAKAVVTVSEKGRVEGDIRVPNVIINGKVFGDIHAEKHVELAAKAEITGNVYYNLIEMVMGSRVDGNLVHKVTGKQMQQVAGEKKAGADAGATPASQAAEEPAKTAVSAISGQSG